MDMTKPEAPEITDLLSGTEYLAQLSLANPLVAERQLMRFLDALLLSPPEPGILLALLEQARAPLCFVEEEMARRYHNKALPLAIEEESYFQQVVSAWRKVGKAYALCARLEEPEAENAQYVSLMATILHRCLYYTGMIILSTTVLGGTCHQASGSTFMGITRLPKNGALPTRRLRMFWKTTCRQLIVLRLIRRCYSLISPALTATACAI